MAMCRHGPGVEGKGVPKAARRDGEGCGKEKLNLAQARGGLARTRLAKKTRTRRHCSSALMVAAGLASLKEDEADIAVVGGVGGRRRW